MRKSKALRNFNENVQKLPIYLKLLEFTGIKFQGLIYSDLPESMTLS